MRFLVFLAGVLCAPLLLPSPLLASFALEAPTPGQTCTGIGLIRGWACAAQNITVTVDGGRPIPTATGGPRGDTRAACGRSDTGFSLLVNWNEYGAGEHTLNVFTDGRLAMTRTVEVVTYGEPFRRDLDGEWTFADWPEPGTDTTVAWNEATQNIEIVDIDRRYDYEGNSPLAPLLGNWMFEYHSSTFNPPPVLMTMTDIDGNQATGHMTGLEWAEVIGRKNTTRWHGQPLLQYELYRIGQYSGQDGVSWNCFVYVFNITEGGGTARARGYRWTGKGRTLDACHQTSPTTYPATGVRRAQ